MHVITGRRKITPAINQSMLASNTWNEETAVTKIRAMAAFNSATHLLKLNAQSIELMNKLMSFSRAQDWSGESRPLVWPSNETLVLECSFELSALRRNLRRLAELGLISFKDSPMGRRCGERDASGSIVLGHTFGIDLSPLGILTPALEGMVAEDKARVAQTRVLGRRFTCLRKSIASIVETAIASGVAGPWDECGSALDAIIVTRSRDLEALRQQCQDLETLLERVQTAYRYAPSPAFETIDCSAQEDGFRGSKVTPEGPTSGTSIENTIENSDSHLYSDRCSTSAELVELLGAGHAGAAGSGKEPGTNAQDMEIAGIAVKTVDPKTLVMLCPNFRELVWAPNGFKWSAIIETVAKIVKPHLEIPDPTWKAACRVLGRERAAVAAALIYEKTEAGLIDCPGAYLNGMITRAEQGRLALSSSLFHWSHNRKRSCVDLRGDWT